MHYFTLALNSIVSVQVSLEEKAVQQTIVAFFAGLHKSYSTLVASTLYSLIKTQTTFTSRKGKKALKTDNKQKILTGITNKNQKTFI